MNQIKFYPRKLIVRARENPDPNEFLAKFTVLLQKPGTIRKIRFIREMGRWSCIEKDMTLHLLEKSER